MKSFKLEKTSGDADVTHEGLLWLAVLVLILIPLTVLVGYFVIAIMGQAFAG